MSKDEDPDKVRDVVKETRKIDHEGKKPSPDMPEEVGGVEGPEPTRFGDWEHGGRCTDF